MKGQKHSLFWLYSLMSVAFTLGGVAMCRDAPEEFSVQRGTLGIVIMTRSGVVLAADSRSTNADGTFADTADKIFRVTNESACTIAGTVAFRENIFGYVSGFDFSKAIEDYRRKREIVGIRPILEEAGLLGRILMGDLARGMSSVQVSEFSDGGNIATVVWVGYAPSGPGGRLLLEAYKFGMAVATSIGPTPNPSARLMANEPTIIRSFWTLESREAPFGLFTNGNAQVAVGILTGNPQSDLSLQVPAIAKYRELRAQGKLNDMSLDEAIALADALINESIRIDGRALGIGGQVDIAVITPDQGFRWVPGHEPERKRQQTPR